MSIYAPNFCPRCGTQLEPDEFDGDTRGYCSECETHVFHLPSPATGIVVVDGDRVLLVQRGDPPFEGKWELPAGVIEYGETQREAAVRELAEETSLRVSPDALTLVDTGGHPLNPDADESEIYVIETTFAVSRLKTTGDPSAGESEQGAQFWPFPKIESDLRPGESERIQCALQNQEVSLSES